MKSKASREKDEEGTQNEMVQNPLVLRNTHTNPASLTSEEAEGREEARKQLARDSKRWT